MHVSPFEMVFENHHNFSCVCDLLEHNKMVPEYQCQYQHHNKMHIGVLFLLQAVCLHKIISKSIKYLALVSCKNVFV